MLHSDGEAEAHLVTAVMRREHTCLWLSPEGFQSIKCCFPLLDASLLFVSSALIISEVLLNLTNLASFLGYFRLLPCPLPDILSSWHLQHLGRWVTLQFRLLSHSFMCHHLKSWVQGCELCHVSPSIPGWLLRNGGSLYHFAIISFSTTAKPVSWCQFLPLVQIVAGSCWIVTTSLPKYYNFSATQPSLLTACKLLGK